MIAARRRRAVRGEGGYTLLIVLVACGMFGLIVASLLAMVGTDALVGSAYANSDAGKRAVDGGLQVGIGTVKSVGSSTLATSPDPCAGFTPNLQVPIENRPIDVTCADATEAAPKSIPSAGDGSTVLTLLREWDIAAVTPAPISDGDVPTLGQRVQGLVSFFGGTTADNPGLIHIADQPLKIYGGVNVRQWALASTLRSSGAGIAVTGSYKEGDSQAAACGTAEPFFDLFVPQRTGVVTATGTRTCNAGRDNVVPAAGPNYPVPAATTTPGTVPACVPGGTVTFAPGVYNPAQILQMNLMFSGGNCDGVTFWFEPGDYAFNAAPDSTIGALYFNDSTSNFVFGAPKGWTSATRAPDAVFPEACDRAAQGVAIVLGATTSVVHNKGAVSMCGRTDGTTPVPVLSQKPVASLPEVKWATEPTTATAGFGFVAGSANATNAGRVAASIAGEVPPSYPTDGKPYDVSEGSTRLTSDEWCSWACARSYILRGFEAPTQGSDRPLTSAFVKIRAASTRVVDTTSWTVGRTRVQVHFTRQDGQACIAIAHTYPTSMASPISVNLLDPSSNCVGVVRNQRDLELGTIEVYFMLNAQPDCTWVWWGYWTCESILTLSVDYMWIEATSAAATSPDPTPMAMQIDAANRRSFNIFGRVYLPRTQIDVKWRGSPTSPPAYELPIFVGDVVARGLISSGPDEYPRHIGPLAARSLTPASRRVLIQASVGGRLLGSTIVTLSDLTPGSTTLTPAKELVTSNWNYCNIELTPTASC